MATTRAMFTDTEGGRMKYRIDGAKMSTREAAHAEIAAAMNFPEYYGRNLNALWDMLTTTRGEIVFTDTDVMLAALGEYGQKLYSCFREAAARNRELHVYMEDKQSPDVDAKT